MAQYKVIVKFVDLEDNNRVYKPGDDYPHSDAPKPNKARIESLSTKKNKRKKELIAADKAKEELESLTVDELKERLDEKEIEYKSGDNKKTLIELLSE